jgi:hypothetical protein
MSHEEPGAAPISRLAGREVVNLDPEAAAARERGYLLLLEHLDAEGPGRLAQDTPARYRIRMPVDS